MIIHKLCICNRVGEVSDIVEKHFRYKHPYKCFKSTNDEYFLDSIEESFNESTNILSGG